MDAVVLFVLRHRWLVFIGMLAFFVAGLWGFSRLNIEAYPDPVPPLVEVVTQSTGQSAEEIERYITIPIEIQMAGVPHVTSVRTISLFGLSDVKIQFTYAFSYDEAEQRIVNRLTQLPALPNGAQPQISPESPIGEIYRYRVLGPPGYSVMDLKTIQDWILERRFKAVPGVIDVSGWGGKTKAYEVAIDRDALVANGLTLPQVITALGNANVNVGGQTVNFGAQAAIVRGVGQIHSVDEIRNTLLKTTNGAPVLLKDVARVSVGNLPRLGIAGQDQDDDIVQGIVLMHRGEKSTPTIKAVEAEVQKINANGILPPGVRLERIYDRSDLIGVTTSTVLHNMVMGIILIFAVQWVFLGSFRSALIVAATIPFALFFAVLVMLARGESANLLSVGAIDFGLIVDATVIMVENVFRHLAEHSVHPLTNIRGARSAKLSTIADASTEVGRAVFFAGGIILVSFLPLFMLSGVEGHIFGPMARTYAYAIVGGLIATFTITPALSALLLPEEVKETETIVVRALRRVLEPAIAGALRRRTLTLCGAAVIALLAVGGAMSLGTEFLPHLEEGNFWIRATMPQSVSLEAGEIYVPRMRAVMKSFPEVITVVSQHGRPDDGTDATGFFNAEFFVPLTPFSRWPAGMTKEKLTEQMNAALTSRFPGIDFNFSQNIQDNVEEAASGVKGENSVKIYGGDLKTLEDLATRVKASMSRVPGITDLAIFRSLGQPTVRIQVDRARAARYGLQPGDINATVQAAIGGQSAGNLYEEGSDRNFPIIVRLAPAFRTGLQAIRDLPIGAPNPSGNGVVQIPLSEVADVTFASGAAFVYRENQERYIPIKFSVRGRDLGGAVRDAQRAVAREVKTPGGYRLEWVGELGDLANAIQQLQLAVPLSIGLIVLLLFLNFGSVKETLLGASVLPMAMVGGIFALAVTRTPLSVSATIGFVGLFGISVMNGIIVLSSFNSAVREGLDRGAAIIQACKHQLRPVMMTCVAACVGLLPAALSTGIGSQVQKPLALVVVGGALLSPIPILIVLPVLIDLLAPRQGRRRPVARDSESVETVG